MLNKAIAIATKAHAGQTDKAEQPSIDHPLRVMDRVDGEYEKITAALHDVVEDTPITLEELRSFGFPEPVIASGSRKRPVHGNHRNLLRWSLRMGHALVSCGRMKEDPETSTGRPVQSGQSQSLGGSVANANADQSHRSDSGGLF